MIPDNTHLSNIRYNYFDALRGFAMVLVVFWHVMYFSIGYEGGINVFIHSFYMPVFFFISGFFAYRSFESWDHSRITNILFRKFKVQIAGTSFFIFLFCIFIHHRLPNEGSFINFAEGYWFTLVLFRFFLVYVAIMYICRRAARRNAIFWSVIISLAILCALLNHNFLYIHDYFTDHFPVFITVVVTNFFKTYFPYFALGLFARAHLPRFETFLAKDNVKTIVLCLVLAIWSSAFLFQSPRLFPCPNSLTMIAYPLGFLTLILVIQFFYSIRHIFDRDTRFSKGVRLIGRRTLDIYFLHYFFLPDLHFLKPYVSSGNPVLLQLAVGLPVAMAIVGLALLAGRVIRMSPVLAEWLLGVKRGYKE